jgi:hypothetical protein
MNQLSQVREPGRYRFLYGPFQLELKPLEASDRMPERLTIIVRRNLEEDLTCEDVQELLNPPAEPVMWITLSKTGASIRRWDSENLSIRKVTDLHFE